MNAKELKLNDVMCGDWIDVRNNANPNTPHIEKITPSHLLRDAHWYGIELTPEILEKNGFKKAQINGEKHDDIYQCFDGEIIIEIGSYDPNFILVRYRYKTPDGINSGELSSIVKADGGKFYLHELQHALKLCGIEKKLNYDKE